MSASIGRRPWLPVALALALATSMGFHIAGWIRARADQGPHVARVVREGPSRQPTLEIDFDTPMVAPEAVNRPLRDGLVRLDPPGPISARFLTTRRLEIRVERPLPLFQRARVIFGSGLGDVAGRPVHARESVAFTTGRLELSEPMQARFDAEGRAICAIEFNGPVSPNVLQEHLHLTDGAGLELAYELTGKNDSWELHLEETPPAGATLRLDSGLPSRLGPAGLASDVSTSLTWSRTLRVIATRVRGEHPLRSLELTFSHVLAPADVASFVDVEPRPKDLRIQAQGPHLTLSGSFPPRRITRVLLKKGLPAAAGLRLAEDLTRPVQVPAPAPQVRIAQGGNTLSTAARPEIRIEGINVPIVEVTLREIYPNNLVPLALDWAHVPHLAGPEITVRVPIDAAADESWTQTLDLDDLLGKPPRGVFRLTVRNPAGYWSSASRLLQVTDLAPIVRVTSRGLVVFVSRLSDGTPVEGARVEAFDKKNQLCASGVTDASGLFLAPTTASIPFVVTVASSDDRAWVDLSTHAIAHAPKDIEGRSTPDGLEAYVYADRGVVRPGEEAHLTALTRAPDGTAGPVDLPLSIRIRGPNRRIVRRFSRRTDAHGMATLDLPFSLDAPAGPYVAELYAPGRDEMIGRASFRVEAIVPDRLEPELTLASEDLRPGSTLVVGLAARLLNGDPIGGLATRLHVRYAPVPEVDRHGFTFGDRFSAPAPFTDPEVQRVLDAEGKATATIALPEVTRAGVPLRVTFELEVVDVSGRAAFTRLERMLLPQGPRLAIARPGNGPFEFAARVTGGSVAACRAVLERVRTIGSWHREGTRLVWRGEELAHLIAEKKFTMEDGTARVRFSDPGNGRFRLRIQAEGALPAAVGFERWGGETSGTTSAGSPRLAVSLVGGAVIPGHTATLAVVAPVAGRALLTVETSTVHRASVVDLTAGPQKLDVEIPDIAVPNVHVTLTLVAGVREANGRPARLLGAVAVPLKRPSRHLAVALEMPTQVAPASEVTLRLETSAPATLRVHLVDEGVLRLTGHRTPNPYARLEATRRLDTRMADIYTTLVEGMHFGGDDAESGGGASLAGRLDPTAKKTIETVALASGLVHCDKQATVTFRLPAYEGRLRVFVVAAGAEGTGRATAPLVVKGPISIAIHVPRAVAPGDIFDVPIQVKGEDVSWDLSLEGLERVGAGDGLRVRAGAMPGLASIQVQARDRAGNHMQRTARFSIRPAAPFSVVHEVLQVAAGQRLDKAIPGTWLPGHATARLVVGSRPGLATLPALEQLLVYPHGCIEQTTSRGFSVLAWSELLRATHPEGLAPEDVVSAAIDRVLSMQTADGGLSFWPGGSRTYDFGSAYAAHFLLVAKRLGRAVPKAPLTALLDNLEGRLRRDRADPYAARVLALAGRSVAAHLEPLVEQASTAEAKADLAAAFLLSGDGQRARTLLGDAGDPWAAPREQGGDLSSPVRAAATLLGALLVVTPDDARIPDLVARLQATLQTGGGTTQDSASALLALAEFHAQRATEPPSRGKITLGSNVHDYEDEGLQLDFDPVTTPRFAIRADSPTTLVLRVAGIPLTPPSDTTGSAASESAVVERGMQVRRWIEAPEGPLRQGQVYRVVIKGTVPAGSENLLITDVLPGGLEIEAARDQEGTLAPDRTEPRDDRVLFFRTKGLHDGSFRQTYLVRAVTVGTFRVPPISAELLYAPDIHARSACGDTLEIVR